MTFRDILENIEFFKYPILVGVLLCLAASIIGVVLVLKRFSMIGDGLSHVSFGVIAVAMCLNLASDLALIIAIPIVIFFAYILLRVGQSAKMKGDAIIALLSSSSLAIAYLFLNETGTSIDIDSYLFGSILFATKKDFLMILPVCQRETLIGKHFRASFSIGRKRISRLRLSTILRQTDTNNTAAPFGAAVLLFGFTLSRCSWW